MKLRKQSYYLRDDSGSGETFLAGVLSLFVNNQLLSVTSW